VLLAGLLLLLCCWYVVVDVLLGVSCAAFSEAFVWFFRFDSLYGLLYSEKPLYSLLSLLDCWASLVVWVSLCAFVVKLPSNLRSCGVLLLLERTV
jgi:hypothetical protein